jgi:hypothetical protein
MLFIPIAAASLICTPASHEVFKIALAHFEALAQVESYQFTGMYPIQDGSFMYTEPFCYLLYRE